MAPAKPHLWLLETPPRYSQTRYTLIETTYLIQALEKRFGATDA